MHIGFDLDKVFINTPPFIPDFIISKLYMKKSNGKLLYRIPGKYEQFIRHISHDPLFRPPIKENLNFLRKIAQDKDTLFLISSRFSFLKKQTQKLVKKYKLDETFHMIHFNFEDKQPHIFKEKFVNELKLDKYVDDDLHMLKYLASKNNFTKFYWFNSKLQKKISNNIKAITKLSEILES